MLVERVLPSPEVKKRIAELAVGLAADCDNPENDVRKLVDENLKNASRLPFVGFVTHDGVWVKGYSGHKDFDTFLRILASVEEAPELQASEAVRKKLASLVEKAAKAAEKDDWKSVVAAVQKGAKLAGRCPERKALVELEKKARDWAAKQLDGVVAAARAGGDLGAAQKTLADVKKRFSGEPEADDAALGMKALRRLNSIVRIESRGAPQPDLRRKAAEAYPETRWAAMFLPGPEK